MIFKYLYYFKVHSPEGQRLHVFLQYAWTLTWSHPGFCFQIRQSEGCGGLSTQTVKIQSFTEFKFLYFKCYNVNILTSYLF